MLSAPGVDYEGGTFTTLESDGRLQEHAFEQGDLLIFQSHKYHSSVVRMVARASVLSAACGTTLAEMRRAPRARALRQACSP